MELIKIEILNWHQYQTRKDVKVHSWFRLQNDFWTNPKFFDFTNDEKMVWIAILSAASKKKSCVIDVNKKQIAMFLNIKTNTVDDAISKLLKIEAILFHVTPTLRGRDVDVTPTLRGRDVDVTPHYITLQCVSSNKLLDTHSCESEKNFEKSSFEKLAELWNEIVKHPKVLKLTKKRLAALKIVLKENPEMEYWEQVFRKIAETPFLRGYSPSGWRADFDWATRSDSHVKVTEGKYDALNANSKIEESYVNFIARGENEQA